MDRLEKKAAEAMETLREAARRFPPEKTALAWSGGKDSTLLVHLARKALGRLPFPLLFIDTGRDFPEVLDFRDRMAREWDLDLRILEPGPEARETSPSGDRELCCRLRKAEPLARALRDLGISALITAVREDENPARTGESLFSPRSDPPHTRVHPLLSFSEEEVWFLIRAEKLPFCPLYEEGFRSLGCVPCTRKSRGPEERSGRDPEKERIMKNLRDLGYF